MSLAPLPYCAKSIKQALHFPIKTSPFCHCSNKLLGVFMLNWKELSCQSFDGNNESQNITHLWKLEIPKQSLSKLKNPFWGSSVIILAFSIANLMSAVSLKRSNVPVHGEWHYFFKSVKRLTCSKLGSFYSGTLYTHICHHNLIKQKKHYPLAINKVLYVSMSSMCFWSTALLYSLSHSIFTDGNIIPA